VTAAVWQKLVRDVAERLGEQPGNGPLIDCFVKAASREAPAWRAAVWQDFVDAVDDVIDAWGHGASIENLLAPRIHVMTAARRRLDSADPPPAPPLAAPQGPLTLTESADEARVRLTVRVFANIAAVIEAMEELIRPAAPLTVKNVDLTGDHPTLVRPERCLYTVDEDGTPWCGNDRKQTTSLNGAYCEACGGKYGPEEQHRVSR